MKNLIVNLLAWALRPVVLKIVAEIPKPETMGDAIRKRAALNAHLTGDYTPENLGVFKNYWNTMVYGRQGKKQ
jgi:hypothetical protein